MSLFWASKKGTRAKGKNKEQVDQTVRLKKHTIPFVFRKVAGQDKTLRFAPKYYFI
jgi:hypothetical protein